MDKTILKEKINQAIGILKEKDIDMWLTFVRESAVMTDPAMEMVVGTNSTWQAAFIINKDGETTAIVGNMEEGIFKKTGLFNNVISYLKSIREPLVEYLKKKDPKSIAINYSKNAVLADGLTHGMFQVLNDYLEGTFPPPRLGQKDKSSIYDAILKDKKNFSGRVMISTLKKIGEPILALECDSDAVNGAIDYVLKPSRYD